MSLVIRQADVAETAAVSAVLSEAAAWLAATGRPMWKADELSPARIAADVGNRLFHVAVIDGDIVGTVKFQLTDLEFWPDVPQAECAFIHRLAVRRRAAGGDVADALMRWAVDRARSLGRRYLRLDTEASRTRLRERYERFGFRHHSNRQVGPYFVARYEIDLTI
jgi:GNAT superfamily N-acetyltransferase